MGCVVALHPPVQHWLDEACVTPIGGPNFTSLLTCSAVPTAKGGGASGQQEAVCRQAAGAHPIPSKAGCACRKPQHAAAGRCASRLAAASILDLTSPRTAHFSATLHDAPPFARRVLGVRLDLVALAPQLVLLLHHPRPVLGHAVAAAAAPALALPAGRLQGTRKGAEEGAGRDQSMPAPGRCACRLQTLPRPAAAPRRPRLRAPPPAHFVSRPWTATVWRPRGASSSSISSSESPSLPFERTDVRDQAAHVRCAGCWLSTGGRAAQEHPAAAGPRGYATAARRSPLRWGGCAPSRQRAPSPGGCNRLCRP